MFSPHTPTLSQTYRDDYRRQFLRSHKSCLCFLHVQVNLVQEDKPTVDAIKLILLYANAEQKWDLLITDVGIMNEN